MRSILAALAAIALCVGAARAADPCADMIRLQREHADHAARADSDPGTMNALLRKAIAAREACLDNPTATDATKDFYKALEALAKPRFAVPPGAVKGTEPVLKDAAYEFAFTADVEGHGTVEWGVAAMPCERLDGKCFPTQAESPNMVLETRVTIDGRPAILEVRGEENKRLSATAVALGILHRHYEKVFGRPLTELSGGLSAMNLANFQTEWAEQVYKHGKSESEAKDLAIRAISFGKQRMAKPFNYTRFEVTLGAKVKKRLRLTGDAAAVDYDVPGKVDVIAKDRRP